MLPGKQFQIKIYYTKMSPGADHQMKKCQAHESRSYKKKDKKGKDNCFLL
jgi:hypothetical protein